MSNEDFVNGLVNGYLKQRDWRVKENSNQPFSFASLMNHLSGSVLAMYTLNEMYPKDIAHAHSNGAFHLHDLSNGIIGYCAGWSLMGLLQKGFSSDTGAVTARPAKHLDTALGQMVNFVGTLQTEWAGAQAFSSFDTYLAPFVRSDGLNYVQTKQAVQRFIYGMNIASRWGQTCFSNITLDWRVPDDLKDVPVIIGGLPQDTTYKEYQKEMDMLNKAFLELMAEGDGKGKLFTFPIPTYNITKDFDWDSENSQLLFTATGKYGIPYFQNFINSDLKPSDVRSMCCRLRLELNELRNKTGGLFGAGENTGSLGVVTINMPRIGYLAKTKGVDFFGRLNELLELAKESLEIKRKFVNENMEKGLMPYSKKFLGTLKNHFSTIGLVGMNEAVQNYLGCDIAHKEGHAFAIKVLEFMRDRIKDFQKESGNIYNLEATPAEGTTYRLAKMDKEMFPDIKTAGDDKPFYTNSSQLPVNYTTDLFAALDLQDPLQTKYTGGTVFHTFLGEKISDPKVVAKLVKRIATFYHLPYFTITPTFSVCPTHGYVVGEHQRCPYH